jgi:SH3-like domain-containing protein
MKPLAAMLAAGLALAALPVAARPAAAQTSQGTGFLQTPPKNQPPPPPQATPSTHPPTAVPRSAVQQVAPLASPSLLGHSAPGKPTPVVEAPPDTHAQKPPPPKHPAKPPKHAAPAHAAPPHAVPPKPPPPPRPPAKPPAAAAAGAAAGVAAGAAAAATPATSAAPAKPAEPTAATPAREAEERPDIPEKGTVTGLPLPRFASLRSDDVNMRTGPGTRYPIEWIYHRRDLPVEIQREYDVWRLVVDQDGVKGWVHSATLTGRRHFVVKGKDRVLRASASEESGAVAILKPGVIGRVRSCAAGAAWCEMQVGEYRGWLRRDEVWGVLPGEAVN